MSSNVGNSSGLMAISGFLKLDLRFACMQDVVVRRVSQGGGGGGASPHKAGFPSVKEKTHY